ncbi:MAG: hypothetical protein QOG23_3579 [Blastocatellia bacterium]|jgi:hypothetical protein|nr:hypothetical protein [Blastocatellia bacterium]
MLSIGINLVNRDFNRKSALVYHICDDVTGKVRPVCGADIELSDNGDASDLLEKLREGQPLFAESVWDDEWTSEMCGRCRRVCLSVESEEKQSKRRLVRHRRKEANANLVKSYKQTILKQRLNRCPKCAAAITMKPPPGFGDGAADCDGCGLKWDFSILAEPDGRFLVLADDETEQHSGRWKSHMKLDAAVEWKW